MVEPIHSTTAAYMLASQPYGTLYVGVGGEFLRRIGQHRAGDRDGFTKRYGIKRLVWFEMFDGIVEAIAREKQIKKYPRQWKSNLIEHVNPNWEDLWPSLVAETLNPQFDPFDPRFTNTRQADFD